MKRKIFCGLCFVFLSIAGSCISDQCRDCRVGRAGVQTIVSYTSSGRQVTRVTDSQGCVTYAPDTNGSCHATVTAIGGGFTFFASPASVDLQSPPSTFTLGGGVLSTAYGMPKIQYWDENGSMLGEAIASSVGSDGSWLESTTPDLSSAYSGYWTIYVFNKTSDGSYEHIGSALVETYGRDYCNATQSEIDACEVSACNSCYFDYDSCQCLSY